MVLTTEQAAAYVGCSTVKQFLREVKRGYWPKPLVPSSRPLRFSKKQLDAVLAPVENCGIITTEEQSMLELERRLGIQP
jgi:hypothetical protein